jgi:hypothetical protein
MIYLGRSYEENISNHKHYKSFVEGLVLRGEEISTKHKLLLETGDIVNVVVLSLMLIKEKIKTAPETTSYLPDEGTLHTYSKYGKTLTHADKPPSINHILEAPNYPNSSKVGQLFSTLPYSIKEQTMFSLGFNYIVELALDEMKGFQEVCEEMHIKYSRYSSNKQPAKTYNKNITK